LPKFFAFETQIDNKVTLFKAWVQLALIQIADGDSILWRTSQAKPKIKFNLFISPPLGNVG